MAAHLFFFGAKALARARRVLLHDMCSEVEELLEREQMLVSLLPPLAEPDQDEILLQVALFLGQRVQPRVLDRDRRLQRKRLRALHLFRREHAMALALGQDGSPDRLAVRDERQGHERLHAECPRVRGVDLA